MIESSFFPSARRRYTLDDYRQLQTKADEKRKKLSLVSELGPEGSVVGMPSWIGDPYAMLAQSEIPGQYKVDKNKKCDGMTVEIYSTNKTKKRGLLLTGCTFKKFELSAIGEDDKAKYFLSFIAYVPDSLELHGWVREHYGKDFFAKFEAAQGELPMEPPPAEEFFARTQAVATADIVVVEQDDEDDGENPVADEMDGLRAADEGLAVN